MLRRVAVVPMPSFSIAGLFTMMVLSMLSPMSEMLFPLMVVRHWSPRSYVPLGRKMNERAASAAALAPFTTSSVVMKLCTSPAFTVYQLPFCAKAGSVMFTMLRLWI